MQFEDDSHFAVGIREIFENVPFRNFLQLRESKIRESGSFN